MAGLQKPISGLPASASMAAADIIPFVRGGVTDSITAGNLRTQLFGIAQSDPLSIGALTAVGNSTITGTLSGITTLTCTTLSIGTLSTSGNVTAGNAGTSGTLFLGNTGNSLSFDGSKFSLSALTAFTTGITVTGGVTIATLGLTVTSGTSAVQALTATQISVTTAVSKIIPGVTSLSLRNNNDNADNILILDNGNVTLRGNLTLSPNPSKIVPGPTSLSHRNHADSLDNLLIADNGDTTIRGNLTLPAGGIVITNIAAGVSIAGAQVIGVRLNGYAAMTGTPDKATAFATSTVTLAQLAGRVMQLQADLTTHGLIGP